MASRKSPFRSLRAKVLLIFLAVTLAIFAGCFFVFQQYIHDTSVQRYQEHLEPLRNALQNNIETHISTCVQTVRSVYYSTSTMDLLTSPDTRFYNAETDDSAALFAFMLNIYAALPSSRQIHLSAYSLNRSFLVTTNDLVRYMEVRPGRQFEEDFPSRSPISLNQSIWIESSHVMHNYAHLVSPYARTGGYVFTIHVPIFLMPNTNNVLGLISVDISTNYISQNCGYINDMGAQVYISDQEGNLVYAHDSDQIGQPLSALPYLSPVWGEESPGDSYIRDGMLVTTDLIDTAYCHWQINTLTPLKDITRDMNTLQRNLLLMILGFMLLLAAIMALVIMRYTRPLNKIASFMHANFYSKDYNLKARLSDHVRYRSMDEIGVLISSIDMMLDTVNRFVVRQYQLLLARRTAELRTLQAQINPHFIYNTLQCIASKTLEKGDIESYNYIASFGQMLQYAMDVDESLVTLEQEVAHVQRYLELQSVRYECTLQCDVSVAPELTHVLIPKMSLQPLVENAVLHGSLYVRPDSLISIRANILARHVVLEVKDNGVGLSEQQIKSQEEKIARIRDDYMYLKTSAEELSVERLLGSEAEKALLEQTVEPHHGLHIGTSNVFIRFLLRFGSQSTFTMKNNETGGTTVTLTFPTERMRTAPTKPSMEE